MKELLPPFAFVCVVIALLVSFAECMDQREEREHERSRARVKEERAKLRWYCKPERPQWILDCLRATPTTPHDDYGDQPARVCERLSSDLFCYWQKAKAQ